MGHDYGVPLRFLTVTPTRDNDAAPGNRLKDKHSRLFCGKTLDEWTMIQVWSSKYAGKHVFVCETEAHAEKLRPIADKYGVVLYVRPRDFLHPLNDTGGVPLTWATEKALAEDYHTLLTHAFVVAPCRPPGFFDRLAMEYEKRVGNPDYFYTQMWVMGGHGTDSAYFETDENSVGRQIGKVYLNSNVRARLSTTQHWMASSHWWRAAAPLGAARHDLTLTPIIVDIEPWMDIHIDTQDQWDWAEYWFKKMILSRGEDCYERYRDEWKK